MTDTSNKATVLIAEDEVIAGLYLQSLVSNMGHAPLPVARGGQQAVELAAGARIDLMLMDIHLADDMDGITAAEIINEDTPVIFYTAYTDEPTITRAKRLNPIAIIEKPATENTIQETIELALSGSEE